MNIRLQLRVVPLPRLPRVLWSVLALMGVVLVASCEPEPTPDPVIPLSPREQLIRLSMDLRGVHPSESELQAIENSPGLYGAFVDRYIEDPRFLGRMVEIFDTRYNLRTGEVPFDAEEAGMEGVDEVALADDLAGEALKLLARIIAEDRPYSEIVTAPYTLANARVAQYWGMEYPEGSQGWIETHYQDGRPEAGVLSMSYFWARYPSMGGNANRHRANALSRIFLCDDFLSRPIVVNRATVDLLSIDPESAIRTNPGCQSCHSSLDPLAANLFGFFHDSESLEEARTYRPENELLWMDYSGRSPGYFGRPTAGIVELGRQIASDARFVDCAVQTVFEGLYQRQPGQEDWFDLTAHRQVFTDNGQSIKALVRSIVNDKLYRAGQIVGDDALAARVTTVRTASPEQLSTLIASLTGYQLTFNGLDALGTQVVGLPVLAGGTDKRSVLERSYAPAVGVALVHERLAQAAAWHVVLADFDPEREGDAKLLVYVSPQDTPDVAAEAFELQIRELYLRVTGVPLPEEAPEVAELMDLWVQLHSVAASTRDAWAGVVTAVLRDPRVLFY